MDHSRSLRLGLLALVAVTLIGVAPLMAQTGPTFDLVLEGGRVMDPETGLDDIRNVGIRRGGIAAISRERLTGRTVLDVRGLVVAPGFIDLHAHGQDPLSASLQARDGVTTALECEIGVFPISDWIASREGRALIHYGATAGHLAARIFQYLGIEAGHTPMRAPDDEALDTTYAYHEATDQEIDSIVEHLASALDEGALGIGLGITYTPGASRVEILRIFELAAARGVPVFAHLRGANSGGTLGAFQEVLANAAATGGAIHIVHMNSSAGELARVTLGMIRGARARGLDVTTESYPYTAGSTRIESALFDSWDDLDNDAFQRLQWPATGERLTAESYRRYRAEGGWVIMHGRNEETNEWIVAQPDVMVASDGIPYAHGPAHPRGAGTFARVLGHYVRVRGALTLMDALGKMTLLPARRLEDAAPQMRRKGRLQVGADADITVFDPNTVIDRATYSQGDLPSAGIVHVLVGGTAVVRQGELVEGVAPGQAVLGRR